MGPKRYPPFEGDDIVSTSGQNPEQRIKARVGVMTLPKTRVTLPSHLCVDNGVNAIKELPDIKTFIRTHVADLDIVSTYPNVQVILNISRETTVRELYKIQGSSEYIQRMAGINLTGGHTNAVEIACDLMRAPNFVRLLAGFEEELKNAA